MGGNRIAREIPAHFERRSRNSIVRGPILAPAAYERMLQKNWGNRSPLKMAFFPAFFDAATQKSGLFERFLPVVPRKNLGFSRFCPVNDYKLGIATKTDAAIQ
jgi:hypothetical protein